MSVQPKSTTNPIIKTNQNTLNSFLKSHVIKKDSQQKSTNTRIPNEKNEIFGGKYHIPQDKYSEFMEIYYREVFMKNRVDHLTECQLDKGPVLVDIDLRYEFSVKQKQYTSDHISDLVVLYLETFQSMFQFEDERVVSFHVLEKSNVNPIEEKKLTKDGIHMVISMSCDHITQTILRKKIIQRMDEIWNRDEMGITNDWDSVFDEGISQGTTNWQLIGSSKPGHEAYRLTRIFNATYDASDRQFGVEYQDPMTFNMEKNIFKLSARYTEHYEPFMTNEFINEYNAVSKPRGAGSGASGTATGGSATTSASAGTSAGDSLLSAYNSDIMQTDVLSITNREQLEAHVKAFLDSIPSDKYNFFEAYEYTMTLPADYYDSGSYTKWFGVGCALRNGHNCLFIIWLAFSAQSSTFDFSSIGEMYDKWQKIDTRKPNGLTIRSIMYWSKRDAPEKYNAVRNNSIDYYIENTLSNSLIKSSVSDISEKKPCGSCDFDIATVLYHLKKDQYVCTSVKNNVWYHYDKHRWKEVDSGSTLRLSISTELRKLYSNKANQLSVAISNLPEDDTKTSEYLKKRLEKAFEIFTKLGKTNEKKNIMIEARDMFYDPMFMNVMDTNPYLLCCTNGVWDFNEKRFRDGKPEDYLSKCTGIDYIPITKEHAETVDEINDFMNKLFPIEELRQYMWDHLSSTLVGTALNQTFNIYIGGGQNGKSVLVTLMSMMLGEYKTELPITAVVTPKRVGVGGLAPEIAGLRGVRYAVMQEPTEGNVLNEGILKELTSGFDTIQARIPYQTEPIRFIPQFKLVVCSNVLPEIRARDHGTWRRIRADPFLSLFTTNPVTDDPDKPYQYKLDSTINEKFDVWKTVYLAMMVERVLKTGGLVVDCETVLKASNEYKQKQDIIAQFINEKVVKEPGYNGVLKKTQVKNEFIIWHESNLGTKGPPPKDVFAYLDRMFGPQVNSGWRGVKIIYDIPDNGDGGDIDMDEIDDPM